MRSYSCLLLIAICSIASISSIKKMQTGQDYSNWSKQVVYSGLTSGILNARASSYNSFHLRHDYIHLSKYFGLCFGSQDPDPEVMLGALGVVNFHGFSIRGRSDADQYPRKVEVSVTLDGQTWTNAGQGIYEGITNHRDIFTFMFDKPVQGLAMRFELKAWSGFPCLKLEAFVSRVSTPYQLVDWRKEIAAISSGIGRVNTPYIHDINHSSDGIDLDFKYSDGSIKGWCGNVAQKNYIEISAGRIVEWTKLTTQGRGDYPQWVTAYTLEYTLNGHHWERYRSGSTLTGNSDQNSHKVHELDKFFAQAIRLYPTSWVSHPCMRMEAYFRNNGWWGFGGNNFY